VTEKMKTQTLHRTLNLQSKVTETFHAKKSFKEGKEKVISERAKSILIYSKAFCWGNTGIHKWNRSSRKQNNVRKVFNPLTPVAPVTAGDKPWPFFHF